MFKYKYCSLVKSYFNSVCGDIYRYGQNISQSNKTVGRRRKTSHFDLEIAGLAFDNLSVYREVGTRRSYRGWYIKAKLFLKETSCSLV